MPQEKSSPPLYELLTKIAEGAVAEVYSARAPGGERVVLKIVRAELAGDSAVTDRFLDEARLCQGFDHPNIVRHLGAGHLPDGRLFLATELLEGVDLRTQLSRSGPLSPEKVVALAGPICSALAYLHTRNVFHRDLTPGNVFLVDSPAGPRPVLLDFGLAYFRGPRLAVTGAGASPFTPEYAAPECIEGRAPDARSDVYSLGAVLYEAFSGHPPFAAARRDELLEKQLHEAAPPLPATCDQLAPVILRALEKRPEDRYATAAEFGAALAAKVTLDQTQLSATQATPVLLSEPLEKPGDVLGTYEIMELIGEGGMGRVFVARHVTLGRRVALKVLKQEQASKRDSVERFFTEARAVNQINHEHIVEVIDFVDDREQRRVYCVMELLAGNPLGSLLKQEPLSVRRVAHIAWQICDALQAAHAAGVVHRDVKPDNIFLIQRSGLQDYVKVLDFGVAKLAAGPDGAAATVTLQGSILGTPTHMAPEQFLGGEVDRRADIYAFGVLLYQMLAGRLPFEGNDFGQLSAQVIKVAAPRLGPRTPGGERIPRSLRRLTRRCLTKDPGDRPQSMQEVAAVLRPLLGPKVAPSRSALWIAAAAVLVGTVAVALSRFPATWFQRPLQVVSPPAAALPASVTLSVSSTPPGARVTRVDTGESLGLTPLLKALPREDREVRLRLERSGFVPLEHSLRLNADVVWDAALVPVAPLPTAPPPQPVVGKVEPAKPPAIARLKGLDDTIAPVPFTPGKAGGRTAHARAAAAQIAYDVGHFDKALKLFSGAYELDPQPNLLFDIAQCHRQLGNAERALFFYKRYLAHAPPGTDLRKTRKLIEKSRELQSDAQRQSRERDEASRRADEVRVLRAKEAAARAEGEAAQHQAEELRAKDASAAAQAARQREKQGPTDGPAGEGKPSRRPQHRAHREADEADPGSR